MPMTIGNAPLTALAGRLLAYADDDTYRIAAPLTRSHPQSGLILRGEHATVGARSLRAGGDEQLLLIDVAAWRKTPATAAIPMDLSSPDELPLGVDLDSWATGLIASGANYVFTPSYFVRDGDWPALSALLECHGSARRPEVITLVPTDAAMLEPSKLSKFLGLLRQQRDRPLAFLFADKRDPLARRQRLVGLRRLLEAHPGSLLLGAEITAATDAITQGASAAAIGIEGGMRRPRRPGDKGGGPNATDFAPGLFLRDLWEHRSPGVYADWYANSPSPTCDQCHGQALDMFTSSCEDKSRILSHNVHAWLDVLAEISCREPADARSWLGDERLRALNSHLTLKPGRGPVEAAALLRYLCELDDPWHRTTTPTGAWR